MEIVAFSVAALFLAVAIWFFLENGKLHKRIVAIDGELKEAQSAKLVDSSKKESKKDKKASKPAADTRAAEMNAELERELDEARDEIKDLKKQVYDLKKSSKQLKKQVKDAEDEATPVVPNNDVVFELHEQIAELKTDNARLEDELKAAKRAKRAASAEVERPKPEPKKSKDDDSAQPAAAAADTSGLEREIDELRDEIKDLNRRLKSTAANVDKQRRRADNNDKAYKITQRQYDAAQERIALLEAGGATVSPPAPKPAAKPEPKAAPKPEPKVAPKPEPEAAPKPEPKPKPKPADKPAGPPRLSAKLGIPKPPTTPKDDSPPAGAKDPANEISEVTERKRPAASLMKSLKSALVKKQQSDAVSTSKDSGPPAVPPKIRPKQADESGGHTAVLTPGALASAVSPADEDSEPKADDSGGHTAMLTPGSLRNLTPPSDAVAFVADSEPSIDESGSHTAVLGPGAFAPPGTETGDDDEGRRPRGSGLFGMPSDAFEVDEPEDPIRSTQFAFPTRITDDKESDGGAGGFASGRLGGSSVSEDENPADSPVPEAESSDARLGAGKRLGEFDLGDIDSAIDEAWSDLDMD